MYTSSGQRVRALCGSIDFPRSLVLAAACQCFPGSFGRQGAGSRRRAALPRKPVNERPSCQDRLHWLLHQLGNVVSQPSRSQQVGCCTMLDEASKQRLRALYEQQLLVTDKVRGGLRLGGAAGQQAARPRRPQLLTASCWRYTRRCRWRARPPSTAARRSTWRGRCLAPQMCPWWSARRAAAAARRPQLLRRAAPAAPAAARCTRRRQQQLGSSMAVQQRRAAQSMPKTFAAASSTLRRSWHRRRGAAWWLAASGRC